MKSSERPAQPVVAIVGLGYVGLPLAVAFGKKFRTIGYDISPKKIAAYKYGEDATGELSFDELKAAVHLEFTFEPNTLSDADFVLIAVPTPVNAAKQPDLFALESATTTVARNLKLGAVVVYESTVYPGATEEVCVPILERESGSRWREGFYVGYSPERINPGDKEHSFSKITKVVSGDGTDTAAQIAKLYGSVVEAGIFIATSIRVAEAAKVIENTQRDLNIALMNELAIIFDRLGIRTSDVLEAAATKWNFLKFTPGLVGGHCIGVDPYYLTHKAEMSGYHPEVILAGRRINDGMGKFIAEKTVKLMIQTGCSIRGSRVNILGITFKENVSDVRNSRVPDIIRELLSYGIEVNVHDPIADRPVTETALGIDLVPINDLPAAQAVILAVPHAQLLKTLPGALGKILESPNLLIDVKSALDVANPAYAATHYWRL